MDIPTLWHPIAGRTDIWDRVFRVEIEYPLDGMPVVNGHVERTYDLGGEKITKHMPGLQLVAPLSVILTDPELSPCLLLDLDAALRSLLYILWQRKIEAPDASA